MIIGVDGNEANVTAQVGVSTYSLHLLLYFQKIATKNCQFVVYLREDPKEFLPNKTEYFHYSIIPGLMFWSQLFLPLNLYMKKRIDVFFTPAHYSPRFCPVPSVVTIHDLSYFNYPSEFLQKDLIKLKNWTEYSIERAKKVIAVSKTTKKDIMKWYKTADEKIEVIYNGYEKEIKNENPIRTNTTLENVIKNPYILYVGTLQPRKNVPTLIRSFSKWKQFHPGYKLVLVGKKGWLYDEIYKTINELKIEDDVIITGYITDRELVTLYINAFCCVLPSFYEGFGLPILESMSYGCPVISSFASSLPEIGADACLYFDPHEDNDLIEKLNILLDKKTRSQLIQKGKKRVHEFSWQMCGEKTLNVLSSAALK